MSHVSSCFYTDESLCGHLLLRPSIWIGRSTKRVFAPRDQENILIRIALIIGIVLALIPAALFIPFGVITKLIHLACRNLCDCGRSKSWVMIESDSPQPPRKTSALQELKSRRAKRPPLTAPPRSDNCYLKEERRVALFLEGARTKYIPNLVKELSPILLKVSTPNELQEVFTYFFEESDSFSTNAQAEGLQQLYVLYMGDLEDVDDLLKELSDHTAYCCALMFSYKQLLSIKELISNLNIDQLILAFQIINSTLSEEEVEDCPHHTNLAKNAFEAIQGSDAGVNDFVGVGGRTKLAQLNSLLSNIATALGAEYFPAEIDTKEAEKTTEDFLLPSLQREADQETARNLQSQYNREYLLRSLVS